MRTATHWNWNDSASLMLFSRGNGPGVTFFCLDHLISYMKDVTNHYRKKKLYESQYF